MNHSAVHKTVIVAVVMLAVAPAMAKVQTRTVEYKQGQTVLEGFLAWDDAVAGKRPGVLVVHEWYGLNDYARARTRQLAEIGYLAFAADIYGKGKRAKTPAEAAKLAGSVKNDRPLLRRRAAAALAVLKSQPLVRADKVAAIGFCFGGTTVLELARSGADLQAVVSFHGGLATPAPAKPGKIKAKILVLHGADDPHVPPKDVLAFQQEMRQAEVDWQMISYGGAVHAFSNPAAGNDPSRGAAYDAVATRRSWTAMQSFFAETIAAGPPQGDAQPAKDQ